MANPAVIATRTGTMLVPGVSRNQRLYTGEVIGKAVKRMQERIADPNGLPIVMRTHHEAGDNSALIVGRISSVSMEENGRAKYTAELFGTQAGRDIATLTTGDNAALRSTSIHGYWIGPVARVQHEGQLVETADDLEVDAIDFTASPGVQDAVLDLGSPVTRESTTDRTPIAESWVDEAKDPAKPYGNVQYADPGYLPDKKKRYPLDTPDHIRAAWSYINQKDNAAQYSAKQLARIKQKIKAAMKRIGAKVSDETVTHFGEIREYLQPDDTGAQGGFCIDAYNGPISITMRACGLDPAELRVIAAAAMDAACDALQAMDPDMDADTDIPGAPKADTDGDGGKPKESTGSGTTLNEMRAAYGVAPIDRDDAITVTVQRGRQYEDDPVPTETTPVLTAGVTTENKEVPAVSEAQTAETTAAPTGRTLSDDDLKALGAIFSQALKETLTPRNATSETVSPTAETPKAKSGKNKALKETAKRVQALEETFESRLTTALAEQKATLRDDLLKQYGTPPRQGYRVHESDNTTGEPSIDDLWNDRANIFLQDFARTPVPVPGTGSAPTA